MDTNLAYQGYATRDRTATLFGQTMGLVAMTAGSSLRGRTRVGTCRRGR